MCFVCVCCYCAMFVYSQKSLEFFQAKGFDSLPQVLVNGAQVDMEEVWSISYANSFFF